MKGIEKICKSKFLLNKYPKDLIVITSTTKKDSIINNNNNFVNAVKLSKSSAKPKK